MPPRTVAHRVAVDRDDLAVQLQAPGDVSELVEVSRLRRLITFSCVRLAPDAHPRLTDRTPVEFQVDAVAIGERDAVMAKRIEHLESLAVRKGEVAEIRMLRHRCVRVVEVIGRLEVRPGSVVEDEQATT